MEVPNSFGRYLLEKQKLLGLSDNEAAYLAGSLFGAGSETTASSISVSIMAAACYPEAQKRVQEELNSIVGLDRGKFPYSCRGMAYGSPVYLPIAAPTIADLESLPQVHAFVLETFRWRPVGADGTRHCSNNFYLFLIYLPSPGFGFAHKSTRDIVWVRNRTYVGTTELIGV